MRRLLLAASCTLIPLVVATGVAWACNPQAQLQPDKASYMPGETMVITGSFFPSNVGIQVSVPSSSVTVTTSSNGSFVASLTAPSVPGSYLVHAVRADGQAQPGLPKVASFEVTAPAPAAPSQLPSPPSSQPPALPRPTSGRPPTLSKRRAIRNVRAAVRAEFRVGVRRTPTCRRTSRLKFACRARWSYGLRRYRGRVLIARSGLSTSPIDRYRISARGTSSFLRARSHRARGRIVVNPRRTQLGQTLRLLGIDGTTDVEVTAGPRVDPFPADEFSQPSAGARYVAIWMQVRNRADDAYDDALSNGAELVTSANTTIRATLGPDCANLVNVPAGETRVGCVAFEVPYGTVLRQLEFRPNSGFGRETGTWRLP